MHLLRQLLAFACLAVALVLVPAAARASVSVNGGLARVRCLAVIGDACDGAPPIDFSFASQIVPSPDGRDLYLLANYGIYDVRLAPDGTMTLGQCWVGTGATTGCDVVPMIGGTIRQLALSPDGRFAYVATAGYSLQPSASITVFARDPATGALSAIQCVGLQPSILCPDATPTHADGAQEIAVSPDGRYVDVLAGTASDQQVVVSSFLRAPDGTLAEIGCLAAKETSGCDTSSALSDPASLLESPDDAHVYAAGTSSIVSLVRAGTGTLREVGCLAAGPTSDVSCLITAGADGLASAVLAPDGRAAYALDQMGLWNLRTAPDGTLQDAGCSMRGTVTPCIPDAPGDFTPSVLTADPAMLYTPSGAFYPLYLDGHVGDVAGSVGDIHPSAVAATPSAVYYFGDGSVFAYARIPPIAPLCADTTAMVTRPSAVIRVQCTDPRGEPLTFTLDAPPAHGTVATTSDGTFGTIALRYVPAPGSATSDSFTFHVDDGLAVGATQTVTVSIAPAAASPAPTAATAGSKAAARVALTFARTSTLRVRHGATTLTFRCGDARCRGTIVLLQRAHAVLRSRFTSDRTGHVHARLTLPHSLRPSGAARVRLQLRVTASAKGLRPHTVERTISLAAAAP